MDQPALEMPFGLMVLWGLVTPEEMTKVTFRALHSFSQQVVVKESTVLSAPSSDGEQSSSVLPL